MQKTFTDQLGNVMEINYPPKRIISIVPSQSELLFDLGLDKEIVGITKFCIHPQHKFKEKAKVGGTKKLNIDLIRALKPDLIIGNKEENTQSDIETLSQEFPVWMSDIYTLDDAMKTIGQIGDLVDRKPEADYLNYLIKTGFNDLKMLANKASYNGFKVVYLIWKNPYMAAGKNTFIDDVLQHIGLENAITQSRYPELNMEGLQSLNCKFVFLSSEPYPFAAKHIDEIKAILPDAKVILVDGEMFSWYGSRLVKAVQYFFEFQEMINNFID